MKVFIIIVASLLFLILLFYFLFIGRASRPEPEIVELNEPILVVGLPITTSDRDIYKDVSKVYSEFVRLKKENAISRLKEPWAAINISMDYDPGTGTFTYVAGEAVTAFEDLPEGLSGFEIPAGSYAVFPVRPKSRLAWGLEMGRMKRYIYTEWLPASGFRVPAEGVEFELHDSRSLGRHPEISLYTGIVKKEAAPLPGK
ncbi:MAG: GyrI-like domain-containing protein [Bacteroidota bacterium]